ncbi:hypothetical protein D3C86_1804750 [compost metagenome]
MARTVWILVAEVAAGEAQEHSGKASVRAFTLDGPEEGRHQKLVLEMRVVTFSYDPVEVLTHDLDCLRFHLSCPSVWVSCRTAMPGAAG